MNKRARKLLGRTTTMLILAGGLLVPLWHAHAQSTFALPFSLTQNSPATAFSIDANGTLIENGPLSSSVTLTLSGTPQMVWLPAFAAFRAGSFSSSQTQTSIGQYSFAAGYHSTASGSFSMAVGTSTASGNYSTALGESTASGVYAMSTGFYASATGTASLAIGSSVVASGLGSVATGQNTTASGASSTATGQYTIANSQSVFAAGQYNVGLSSTGATPNATSWVTTDPLLELGNGTSSTKSDALVVYKNGAATFQGVVTVAAGGDIPMYTGQ